MRVLNWRVACLAVACAAAGSGIAGTLAAQSHLSGIVYDSLQSAPLWGADVWVRGTNLRAQTDRNGRFVLDSVVPGRYTLLVSHPGLDSAGLYTLAVPFSVTVSDSTPITVATPSLATLWNRLCGEELGVRSDSGLVFGVVQDATTRAHLAGAGVLIQWVRLHQTEPLNVRTEQRSLTARTDSTGTYYACGVSRDMKLALRGYAQSDSTGLLDVTLGPRAVGRQDLSVALAPARAPAVLRGTAETSDGIPVIGGRVTVREGGSTMVGSDGSFTLRGVTPGTQWVTVQAIGRAPTAQAVDFPPGDTIALAITLFQLPVQLAAVRVTAPPTRLLAEFEERRRLGIGYGRTEAELARMGSLRGAFTTLPSARLGRGRGNTEFTVLLPAPGAGGRGYCVATLYIDGFMSDYEMLAFYRPSDLVGIELFPRASGAPAQYQSVSSGCGVVLVWTKYLK